MATKLRGKNTLSSEQRAEKMQEAWVMRQRGDTQEAIALELDVDQSTVSRFLKTTAARLAKVFEGAVAGLRAEQSAQLDYIQQRAMTAFTRSEKDAEMSREKSAGEDTEVTTETRGQSGDAKLLQVAVAAIALKADLHGTRAPKKAEITGANGAAIKISSGDMERAEAELSEWRKQMANGLANLQSAPPTLPTSATPTE